jgi:hypothetical protein
LNFGNIFLNGKSDHEDLARKYQVGTNVTVYYNPANPQLALLSPGPLLGYWILLVIALYTLLDGLVILFVGGHYQREIGAQGILFDFYIYPILFIVLIIPFSIMILFGITIIPTMLIFFLITAITASLKQPFIIQGSLLYLVAILYLYLIALKIRKESISNEYQTWKSKQIFKRLASFSLILNLNLFGFMSIGWDIGGRLGQVVGIGSGDNLYNYYETVGPVSSEEYLNAALSNPLTMIFFIILLATFFVIIYEYRRFNASKKESIDAVDLNNNIEGPNNDSKDLNNKY